MRDAQKPSQLSLANLISRLQNGRFVVPNFQRDFEWSPWDIRDLMRSIFLDYYVGSLLLWKGKRENFEALSCEPIYGVTQEGDEEHIVLDGQQRLTAINYAFLAPEMPLPKRANQALYFIHIDQFMMKEYDNAFSYDFMSARLRKFMEEPEAQFASHKFPISMLGGKPKALYDWCANYVKYWESAAEEAESASDDKAAEIARAHATRAKGFEDFLEEFSTEYQISYIELDRELELDKICDIFTQINSRGVRLDVFDLVNALLTPQGLELKRMWQDVRDRLDFLSSDKTNVYILQVMSILRQNYCSPKYLYFLLPNKEKSVREPDGTRRKEILIPTTEEFEERWNQAVAALERAIKVVRHPQEFGAISSRFLPYASIFPAFAALQEVAKGVPPEQKLSAQRKVRHWYWASVFTNRYSGSVESTTARDYLDVSRWIEDDEAEPGLISEFSARFRHLELRREVNRSSSVYNGIFNLFVVAGAPDWATGAIPQADELDDHHIVPASWGVDHLEGGLVHTILNRAPLTADTNRLVIKDKLPNQYLPEWIKQNGDKEVRAILEKHLISPVAFDILLRDPFTPHDFEEFIAERQRSILSAIEDLLIKQRLDLPANLRELDESIEHVEIGVRRLIAATLGNDIERLPPHVRKKAGERIDGAEQKDPNFDAQHYQTLEGLLEFCDFRELQDTILAKTAWPDFEQKLKNKNLVSTRFGQIAELRNGIRHSRKVDSVTQKEGEAALDWFKPLLAA